MDEYNSGMDPEVKRYFLKIVNSFSIAMLWLLIFMTAGLYFRLGLINDQIEWYNITYYIFVFASLVWLLFYYKRVWSNKNHTLHNMPSERVMQLAHKLWNYHHMHHKLEQADCILVLGSHDLRVAYRGAELYLRGFAPLLVFSGGLGNLTLGMWKEPEADQLARIAISLGVPKEAILIENKSTNTGENILFTQELFKKHGIDPQRFILVQKPYMERRSFATFKKHWPEKELMVTSAQVSLENYPNDEIRLEQVINLMVGDLQRIKEYPKKGFQIYQPIPDDVWAAYNELVQLGYNNHLIKA
jgi:uncharacterized SAM-binding protein YcdF (DUF218 family)